MQVKVIRPNPELGVLAHMAGVVKINPSGTLKQMREDINHTLPGYLGSVRYLFLTRKFKIIDPRTEKQLVVSGVYKKTVYVKVFHGAGKLVDKSPVSPLMCFKGNLHCCRKLMLNRWK